MVVAADGNFLFDMLGISLYAATRHCENDSLRLLAGIFITNTCERICVSSTDIYSVCGAERTLVGLRTYEDIYR